jgi:adenylate kinase
MIFHPPKEYMKDDVTGEPLVHRPNDSGKVFRERLSIYHQRIGPITDYYKRKGIWRQVDGTPGPIPVFNSILNALDKDSS